MIFKSHIAHFRAGFRAKSTKTRIETGQSELAECRNKFVSEQNPPKQGLKRYSPKFSQITPPTVSEQNPPKQGLKLTRKLWQRIAN